MFKTSITLLVLLLLLVLCCGFYFYLTPTYLTFTNSKTDKRQHPQYIATHEKFINRHDRHHSSPSLCNCTTVLAPNTWNSSSTSVGPSRRCCERIIWRTHKFGSILLLDLFRYFAKGTPRVRIQTKPTPKSTKYTLPDSSSSKSTATDYRHVMVTRNWFDAIVSGYLYHKAGYECWIDFRGYDRRRNEPPPSVHQNDLDDDDYDWTSDLTFHNQQQMPFPPRNNRSLCSYLQQESEEVGISIVMDVALSKWYRGVVPYYNKVQQRFQLDQEEHALFLCYNDLVDPFQQEATFYRIVDWMFPGLDNVDAVFDMPPDMKASLINQQQRHSIYSGGHATTHDPQVRTRLLRMVQRLDRDVFHNTIANSNAIFGCAADKL